MRSWIERRISIPFYIVNIVDLLVRSWIESAIRSASTYTSRVDLLVRSWIERAKKRTYPHYQHCRPPCEVVNWKLTWWILLRMHCWSTSLWGRELKGTKNVHLRSTLTVDLLVRSWIERYFWICRILTPDLSTSLWGRELKELSASCGDCLE